MNKYERWGGGLDEWMERIPCLQLFLVFLRTFAWSVFRQLQNPKPDVMCTGGFLRFSHIFIDTRITLLHGSQPASPVALSPSCVSYLFPFLTSVPSIAPFTLFSLLILPLPPYLPLSRPALLFTSFTPLFLPLSVLHFIVGETK